MRRKSYTKIQQLGKRGTLNIFAQPVVIEEKVDGSQFSFGLGSQDGILRCRSHHQKINIDEPQKMFSLAVEIAKRLKHLLLDGHTYRGEFLAKLCHNKLVYDRVPTGHIVIFDIDKGNQEYMNRQEKEEECARLDLECVPVLFEGMFDSQQDMLKLLEQESFLGGPNIEGIVIKQYNQLDSDGNILMAKYVSEAFKEVMGVKKINQSNGIVRALVTMLRTNARWDKALQHLKETDRLKNEPSDIGLLIKEVQQDTLEEEEQLIKDTLFAGAKSQIGKGIVAGLPDWYKLKLAERVTSYTGDQHKALEDIR